MMLEHGSSATSRICGRIDDNRDDGLCIIATAAENASTLTVIPERT
jgi:hypothetical protein